MSRLKGVYTAFEAIALILKERADIIVTFGGPLEDEDVRSCLEGLQINYPGRIRYLGYVEDAVRTDKDFQAGGYFYFSDT